MAHHQHTNNDRMLAAQGSSSTSNSQAGSHQSTVDDEVPAELDEPPDVEHLFAKRKGRAVASPLLEDGPVLSPSYRNASLLTQALLTSPEFGPISDNDAPHLTSDEGMTSPTRTTTPSPPLPATAYLALPKLGSHEMLSPSGENIIDVTKDPVATEVESVQEHKVEETLGRRRCISFACGKTKANEDRASPVKKASEMTMRSLAAVEQPTKRPCLLRFACPAKPARTDNSSVARPSKDIDSRQLSHRFNATENDAADVPQISKASESVVSILDAADAVGKDSKRIRPDGVADIHHAHVIPKVFNRIDFQQSEATSFHEFAGSYYTEDEWTNEQTAYRHKMTISDTLEKENAIRRLAEEAEEEALDEEEAELDDEGDNEDDVDADSNKFDRSTNDGNESDDEEGFAESDDESESGTAYQFWTPGLTTAATSTEYIEYIRPLTERVASNSSIEYVIEADSTRDHHGHRPRPRRPALRLSASTSSDDFIIGTLDEDRPLHEAYLSSLEQRKRQRQILIPQDIDPSFPTSDPEAEDEGNESEDEDNPVESLLQANVHRHTTHSVDSFDEEPRRSRRSSSDQRARTPVPSPKYLRSPLPPPRRLFGDSTHRLRSPPPTHNKLASPPSSRRPSPLVESPSRAGQWINMPHLAQRPNLTHTASLPRKPNPFWKQHRMSNILEPPSPPEGISPKTTAPGDAEYHTRGPIDIVQGLENKRQRRKEKFWRIHCQKAHAGKEKDRKCQPGKGAERMREVGREMQDKYKNYHGNYTNDLMLSV